MSERPKCRNCGKTLRAVTGWVERPSTAAEVKQLRELAAKIDKAYAEREAAGKTNDEHLWQRLDSAYDKLLAQRSRLRVTRREGGQHITVTTPETGRYGQDGLGLFCKRACGEAFGVAAARAGYKRVSA